MSGVSETPTAFTEPRSPDAAPTTVRLFAAAKAAVGVAELTLPASAPTITDALAQAMASAVDPAAAARVFARCTFLVDAVARTDPQTPLPPGATLDVLPPFAGG